jgi:RNA polymerase sigma-70 factor (ECF subfamily)
VRLSKLSAKIKEDETLMRLVVKGNREAFEVLVDRHMRSVFKFSYSFLYDAGKAEDVTQETFTTLWLQADSWQPTGKVKSWLYRIARNKSIDEIRARKNVTDIEEIELEDGKKSAESKVFEGQITTIVDENIKRLPSRQAEAIMLVHFLENTNIEAAEIMEISVDALESLLARGRKKLRELLSEKREVLFGEDNHG